MTGSLRGDVAHATRRNPEITRRGVGASTPITLTDHLRIASVAKAFSGAVSLDAVVAGKLSLDDTVVRRFRRRRSRASVLDSTAAISTPNGVAAM